MGTGLTPLNLAVATLEGGAPSVVQPEMAEFDAWSIFGVDKADNRLEARP